MATTQPRAPIAGPQRSTCLFCSDPVLIPSEDAKARTRNDIVKSLCFHMQMEAREVPKTCTQEMFPFCPVCERLVVQLWENEKVIQEAQKKITKNIATIERTVADAELLKPTMGTPSAVSTEAKKFTKLRETILDGYRTKLLMKQKLRENLTLGNDLTIKQPFYSHVSIMQDKAIGRQFKKATVTGSNSRNSEVHQNTGVNVIPTSSSAVAASSSSALSQEDPGGQNRRIEQDRGNPPTVPNPNRVLQRPTQRPPRPPNQRTPGQQTLNQESPNQRAPSQLTRNQESPNQRTPSQQTLNQETCRPPIPIQRAPSQQTPKRTGKKSVSWGVPVTSPEEVAVYNENSCTLEISRIQSNSVPASTQTGTSVIIKQEPQDEALSPIPIPDGKRRRRSLFQGIEIMRVTDHRANSNHLQCSICRHTVPITGYSAVVGLSPYQTMTQHITERHLGKRRRAAVTASQMSSVGKKKKYTCKLCARVFDDLKSMYEHKMTHGKRPAKANPTALTTTTASSKPTAGPSKSAISYYRNMECDVCHRPVKGNLSNLLSHKFSHKNNEEREIAIRNGEKGARSALLRDTGKVPPRRVIHYQSKKGRKISQNKKYAKLAKKEGGPAPSKCQICYRVFARKCHLILHMKGHARRSQLPILLTKRPASATVVSVAQPSTSTEQPQGGEDSQEPTDTLEDEADFLDEMEESVDETSTLELDAYSPQENFQNEEMDYPDSSVGNLETLQDQPTT